MVLQLETEKDRINKDFLWTVRNSLEIQKKYEGKWVAIIGEKIVSSGKDAKEAYEIAKKGFPNNEPLLEFIPKKELLVL